MTALGFALLLLGAVLVVAEAHVPGGVLGVAGAVVLILGGTIIIAALGGGAALAVPVAVALAGAAAGWVLVAAPRVTRARRAQIRSGAESLSGRTGVVRRWAEPDGQVFVDGALWRARHTAWSDDEGPLAEGDHVVVERVTGLTLCVRRAEEWELIA
jgi:membrane-bound serine protease (ClpP class)